MGEYHPTKPWTLAGVWPLFALLGCPVAANLMIQHVGYECPPCLLPVAPGIWTASGVYVAGLSLAVRDVVHERFGGVVAFVVVVLGAGLSAMISPAVALASASAFVLSEAADAGIYSALRRGLSRPAAVMVSGVVGAVVDGISFVWIAFGSLDLGAGNVIGKLYASAALAAYWWRRQ